MLLSFFVRISTYDGTKEKMTGTIVRKVLRKMNRFFVEHNLAY
ncbi:hypothetical protein C2W64_04883 [Brevibacillus laterosporus]|nr:hypothetical protein C2W64_04883 [Brevibacillus laterosporus]